MDRDLGIAGVGYSHARDRCETHRGQVDAGAAATIHQALLDLAAQGSAVLIISQDLDELLSLTDRLAVINEGVLSAPLATREASAEQLGLLMGGLHGTPADHAAGADHTTRGGAAHA